MKKKSYIPTYQEAIKWNRPKPKETIDWFKGEIKDDIINNASILELQNLLKVCEDYLSFLKKQKNPYLIDENFGGTASQLGYKHHSDIQTCEKQIDVISVRIKSINKQK
ncbi:MAG: hypothetical protein IJ638_01395 [Alphaproteobacteria bacterium]|nr:hypothetical protein [Alphaproteobacteria bacterium]